MVSKKAVLNRIKKKQESKSAGGAGASASASSSELPEYVPPPSLKRRIPLLIALVIAAVCMSSFSAYFSTENDNSLE
jgi:hypothetical protein